MKDLNAEILAILARRDWRLAHPDRDANAWSEFTAVVQEILAEAGNRRRPDEERLNRAVIGAYCPILHAACADGGSERQRRAFEELWQWIYPRVCQRVDTAQDAEDVAQQILLKVYKNLDQVTDPRGFLAWVNKITRRTISDHYRRQTLRSRIESTSIDAADSGDTMNELQGPDELLEAELAEAEKELVDMIYECMPKGRRRRAEVLIALVLEERSVAKVAQKYQTTPENVHLLYFRARKDLPKYCSHLIEVLLQHLTPSQRRDRAEADS